MAANKQTDRHTHARAQCSHASVGLAQARPNKWTHIPTHSESYTNSQLGFDPQHGLALFFIPASLLMGSLPLQTVVNLWLHFYLRPVLKKLMSG